MEALRSYPTVDEAERAAATLVEHGMGATVDEVPDSGHEAGSVWELAVLPTDADRAREMLGITVTTLRDGDASELTRETRSVLIPVLVGAVVLLVVPLIAFFVTFKLSGG